MSKKPIRFEIRLSDDFAKQIDAWRREQSDIPSRAEAARRLIRKALEVERHK